MQQRDYLLREIEKIGLVMAAIRQKLFGGKGDLFLSVEKQLDEAKGKLLNDAGFDLDKILIMSAEELNQYLALFQGFNVDNIELLAETLARIGFDSETEKRQSYLQKALQLYELCNGKDKTYSVSREKMMEEIKMKMPKS